MIVVDLPAPFSPRRPKTEPVGHLEPEPVDGRPPPISLGQPLDPDRHRLAHRPPPVAPMPSGPAAASPPRAHSSRRIASISSGARSLRLASSSASRSRRRTNSRRSSRQSSGAAGRHLQARPPDRLQDPLPLEVPVSPGHRVRVDHQLLRQLPDRRDQLPRPEQPRRHRELHLVADLGVDRPVVGRVRWKSIVAPPTV